MLSIPGHPGRTIFLMRWFAFACLFAVTTQSLADNVTIIGVNVIDVVSGEMAPDRVADFIMLNGNPLDDINACADPIGVYTGGAWLDRGALMDIRARSQLDRP